jgi:hypothetical protein
MYMSKAEFCMRGFRECPASSPILQLEQESNDAYFDRMIKFWKERIESFGTIYLLPHHFVGEHFHSSYYSFLNRNIPVLKMYMMRFAEGIQDGAITKMKESVASMHPEAEEFGGDFNIPYNQDVMGKNLRNKDKFSIAVAAHKVALISSDRDFTIACNPIYDPLCFISGVFGSGKHCVAGAIDLYKDSSPNRELSGDGKILHIMINFIRQNNLESKGVKVIEGSDITGSKIILSHLAALGETGAILVAEVNRVLDEKYLEQRRKWEEEMEKKVAASKLSS